VPWRCPACGNHIVHETRDPAPTAGARYRCHICRIDLEYRISIGKLVVVRGEDDIAAGRPRKP
jgi:DNA-directed RNA polymerase subunit RPC12/RpoP